MKNRILIVQNNEVVENMVSKISTGKELRTRISKHFPGDRRVYFKIDKEDSNKGCFFVSKKRYDWLIAPNKGVGPKKGLLSGRKLRPVFILD